MFLHSDVLMNIFARVRIILPRIKTRETHLQANYAQGRPNSFRAKRTNGGCLSQNTYIFMLWHRNVSIITFIRIHVIFPCIRHVKYITIEKINCRSSC